jgi:hypothetical protein
MQWQKCSRSKSTTNLKGTTKMASLNFNAEAVEPVTAYDVLPKGKYLSMAVASEMKQTKAGTGEYLQITFEVLEGSGKGRKLFERLNIRNQNKQAEEIANRQLSALCHATGVMLLSDSEQLHNIPVVLDVGIEEGRDGYEPQNRIKGYSAAGGSPVHRQAVGQAAIERAEPAAPALAAAPRAAAKPVWKKAAA